MEAFAKFINRDIFDGTLTSEESLLYAKSLATLGYTNEEEMKRNPPSHAQLKQLIKQMDIKIGPCARIAHWSKTQVELKKIEAEQKEMQKYGPYYDLMKAIQRAENAEENLENYMNRQPRDNVAFENKVDSYVKLNPSYATYILDTVNAVVVLFLLPDKVCPIKITGTETTILVNKNHLHEIEPILQHYRAKLNSTT